MKNTEAAEDRIEKPPYTITSDMLAGVERIGEAIGRAEAAAVTQDLRLRRINRIRTIHGSLAIEGNTLSEEQISTILDGKPVATRSGTFRKSATPSKPTTAITGGTRPTSPTCSTPTRR